MTDSVRTIWEFLTVSGTGLNALVQSRVWSPEAPVTFRNEQAAIVYEMLDEERTATPRNSVIVGFKCYGGKRQDGKDFSHDDARAVYLALHDRLNQADGAAMTSGTILVCAQQTGAQSYGEDDSEWPVVEAQYRFEIE